MTFPLRGLNPVVQALAATGFTWGMTTLGAAAVFLARGVNQRLLDTMLSLAGGVMIAASYWSLLAPAIEFSQGGSLPAWLLAVVDFLSGAMIFVVIAEVVPEARREGNTDLATIGAIGGFALMMLLDVAFG